MDDRQAAPDDSASAAAAKNRAAAEELFASYLAANELGEERGFEALCSGHAGIAEELRLLRRAHRRARALLLLGWLLRRSPEST